MPALICRGTRQQKSIGTRRARSGQEISNPPRSLRLDSDHELSAVRGATRIARLAGTNVASTETMSNTSAVPPIVSGSEAVTPYSCARSSRAVESESNTPNATPTSKGRIPLIAT